MGEKVQSFSNNGKLFYHANLESIPCLLKPITQSASKIKLVNVDKDTVVNVYSQNIERHSTEQINSVPTMKNINSSSIVEHCRLIDN